MTSVRVIPDSGLSTALNTSGDDPSTDWRTMKTPLAAELETNSPVTEISLLPVATALALWTSYVASVSRRKQFKTHPSNE